MSKKEKNYLYWTPRILAIISILFISMFALDVFSEGYGFWVTIWALIMHLVPTFILVIVLIIAWRWEHVGGIIYILLGAFYIIMTANKASLDQAWLAYLMISGPLFLIGILFLLNKYLNSKKKS